MTSEHPALRMPAETDPHERTLMAWPCRADLWGSQLEAARADYALVADTIARFEPVTMIARPAEAEAADAACGAGVEVLELPLDDSWIRDNGPIVAVDDAGGRIALDFAFNAWGEKYLPYDDDALVVGRWSAGAGLPRRAVPLVLEGGSIAVDGAGTLVTTEQCLLHLNRNPGRSRVEIEEVLRTELGVTTIIWLPLGLDGDDDTDGHVDNVAAFACPGVVVAQGCDDPDEPDQERLWANRTVLAAARDAAGDRLQVVDVGVLPFATVAERRVAVPYLNLYAGNGFVVVPTCGNPADDEMLGVIASAYPGREVVPVPGAVIAYGGGGPHCITQQVPAAPD
jgi:agmatine deiminase